MSRIKLDIFLPKYQENSSIAIWAGNFIRIFTEEWRKLAQNYNSLQEGRIGAVYSAAAAPTTGEWMQGDFVRNSSPAEAGGAGSKYIITGWICTVSGEPGTWLSNRVLTGN